MIYDNNGVKQEDNHHTDSDEALQFFEATILTLNCATKLDQLSQIAEKLLDNNLASIASSQSAFFNSRHFKANTIEEENQILQREYSTLLDIIKPAS